LINSLLSYFPFPISTKIILILLLVMLFVMGLRLRNPALADSSDHSGSKVANQVPLWIWMAVGCLALVLRFAFLTTYDGWPGDYSIFGYYALELNHHWSWQFFFTPGQIPPLWFWINALFFHLFDSPSFNLWFPPALVTFLSLVFSTLAVRRLFPGKLLFPFFFALSSGFWPVYVGRDASQAVLVPLFESLCFLFLERWVSSNGHRKGWAWGLALGFFAGLGVYSYVGFLSVLLAVVLGVLWLALKKPELRKSAAGVGLILLAVLVPLGLAAFRERIGGYFVGVSLFSGYFKWGDQLLNDASFLTCLLWGPLKGTTANGPALGGILNPLEGAFLLIGLLEWWKKKKGWNRALPLGLFLLFLLPGLLSADSVETLRILPVMPILYLAAAWGFLNFWDINQARLGKAVLVLLALVSVGLNLYQLAIARTGDGSLFKKISVEDQSNEGYWAYQRLAEEARHEGPGLVFSDFILLPHDHALHVMTFPWNALLKPGLDPDKAKWAGILTNVHYGSFLAERFPQARWTYVTPVPADDGGSVLGIIPVTRENQPVFFKWASAQVFFREMFLEAQDAMNDRGFYTRQVEKLPAGYGLMQGDPFLESVYGEWVAQYHMGNTLEPNLLALKRALKNGYPTANLYFKLGNFLAADQKIPEAEVAFAQALRCQPNHTQAGAYLKALQSRGPSK